MKQRYSREKFGLAIVMFMLVLMPSVHAEAIIIDHTCTDLSQVPDYWLDQAKNLTIHYAHTSHGGQINSGLLVLEAVDPVKYSFARRASGTEGLPPIEDPPALRMYDGNPPETYISPNDYWDGESGMDRTRAVADTGNYNLSMWSWCGQQSGNTEATTQSYIDTLNTLESEYPEMRFIYMTGHTDGTGETGNLNVRNNQVRDFCIANGKILFDFADIESYDPNGNYFLDKGAEDDCDYWIDSVKHNWADEWCAAHPGSDLCISCSCAHSKPLNCNQKARAVWWMMARLAGWDGLPENDVIYVPDDYAKIQWAVDNASIDDTIIVRDGTYTENVDVDKRLTIRSENGAGNCIVNAANPCDHVFELLVDSVIINGFTVRNATGDMITWKIAGILVTHSDHVDISDCVVESNVFGIRADFSDYSDLTRNIVRNNTHGVYLASSPYATLTENALSNNRVRNLDTSGTNTASYWHKHTIDTTNTVNGKPVYYYKDTSNLILENLDAGHISLIDCTGATVRGCSVIGCDELRVISTDDSRIEGNTVCNTEYAIRLLYSDNNTVLNNIANDNSNGIRVQYGGNNRVENNTLKRNQQGVFVEGCDNTTVIDNTIEDSTDYGCWLCNNNHVLNNMIQGSKRYGLCITGYNNLVSGNTIIDSEDTPWSGGISLSEYSSGNLIYNNFFDNPNNTWDDGTSNIWNTTKTTGPNIIGGPFIGGNYWGDYTGTDGDRDGFGDTPYNITGGLNRDYLPLVYAPVTCGDVTGDGTIDTVDLLLLLEYVVTGTPIDPCIGDIDGNGHINVLDARLLMGYINNPGGYSLHCGC